MTFTSDAAGEMGNGPYATPLVSGDRVFTAGVAGRFQCFEKRTGKLVWTQQLWSDHHGSEMMYGYASSPIAFRQLVIVPVGGRGKALMAFDQADGKIVWRRNDFGNAYSSPAHQRQKATFVWADQKLITLDQDGNLMIAYPSTQGFRIAAKAPLMTRLSWTPPALVGTRLYLRDRQTMMAVDLG
jgi:outer membrane protein assembly factor BamB